MSKIVKRARRKEDVKGLILDAAKKLFVEQGYPSASIRKIASAIGYSPTTIYLYYKDKNDIVYALHQEGFAILKTLFTSLLEVESPFERLKAIGRTYLQFARNHPDYYEVMFMVKEPMDFLNCEANKENWEEGKQVFGLLLAAIHECQKEGYFKGCNPEFVALQAWAVVHGLCSLYLSTRLQKVAQQCLSGPPDDTLMESAFKTYAHFMETTKIK